MSLTEKLKGVIKRIEEEIRTTKTTLYAELSLRKEHLELSKQIAEENPELLSLHRQRIGANSEQRFAELLNEIEYRERTRKYQNEKLRTNKENTPESAFYRALSESIENYFEWENLKNGAPINKEQRERIKERRRAMFRATTEYKEAIREESHQETCHILDMEFSALRGLDTDSELEHELIKAAHDNEHISDEYMRRALEKVDIGNFLNWVVLNAAPKRTYNFQDLIKSYLISLEE